MRDHDKEREKRTMVSSNHSHSTNVEEQETRKSIETDISLDHVTYNSSMTNAVDGQRGQTSNLQSNGNVSELMSNMNHFSGQYGNGNPIALGENSAVVNGAVSKNMFQNVVVYEKELFQTMGNGTFQIPSPVLGPMSAPPTVTVPEIPMSYFDDIAQSQNKHSNTNLLEIKIATNSESNDIPVKQIPSPVLGPMSAPPTVTVPEIPMSYFDDIAQSQNKHSNTNLLEIKIATNSESNDIPVKALSPVASTSSSSATSNVPPSGPDVVLTQPLQAPIMSGAVTSTSDVDVDIDSILNSPKAKDDIVEKSPGGRYLRFSEKLGSGAYKEVYRAYDTSEGIEVAWNVVHLSGINKAERQYIVNEVRLLEKLNHSNIISFHGSWVNRQEEQVIFVTEILSSGTLKQFINKVKVIRYKIAKRWAIQILKGLSYLHSQDPPIIHRDLKCDNIFINGTSGDLRIGDLGLSTVMSNSSKVCTNKRTK
jgi:hypothetical protein